MVVLSSRNLFLGHRSDPLVPNVKSIRGAECGTDHSLILVKVNQRIAVERRKEEIQERRIDTEKLKVKPIADEFRIKLENRFKILEDLDKDEDVNSTWNNFKEAVLDSAEEVCGKKKKKSKKPWFDCECEQMLEERIRRKNVWMNSNNEEDRLMYNQSNKETNKFLRRKKRQYIKSLLDRAEEENTANNAKDFYRKVRFFKKGFTPCTYGIKNKEGQLLTESVKVLERWREYFEELLNVDEITPTEEENQNNEDIYFYVEPFIETPTKEEVQYAIKSLKNDKAPERDEITADIIKRGGNIIVEKLWNLITKIWEQEEMPMEWQEAVIIPIHKKGSKCSVRIDGHNCNTFEVNSGVRQGDGLSPILFNFAIEEALQKVAEKNIGVKIGTKINILAFADDVVIITEKLEDLKALTEVFMKETEKEDDPGEDLSRGGGSKCKKIWRELGQRRMMRKTG
ncbi:uncharacterized protein LOC129003672 [Macrosteles quadrilineatus]|uniref:uncharacterized protein LOC129003672 n=1 Tax=Macrosteles quadrilineatus TaxID=74068 RepID=UPI0023E11CB9|nr:uncharacterized protein LOC129003672 [Macrosteles quadrilineatus]